jgi:hypothetical protein
MIPVGVSPGKGQTWTLRRLKLTKEERKEEKSDLLFGPLVVTVPTPIKMAIRFSERVVNTGLCVIRDVVSYLAILINFGRICFFKFVPF